MITAEQIPDDLKRLDRWIIWRFQRRTSKDGEPILVKVPQGPHGNINAHDPANWLSFDKAGSVLAAILSNGKFPFGGGIGFVPTDDDDIGFVDFDGCRDPATGQIAVWARRLLDLFPDAYGEISPGGKGMKVIVRGASKPRKTQRAIVPAEGDLRINGKEPGLELYFAKQFTTITGQHLSGQTDRLFDCSLAWAQVEAFVFGEEAGHEQSDDEPTDLAEVESALSAFMSVDVDRATFIGIGMALKGEFGEDGRQVWLDWMAKSPDDDPEANERNWDSFPDKPRSIGTATIFYWARKCGWKPVRRGRGEGDGKGAHALLGSIIDTAELWHDQWREPYATITVTTADGRSHQEHLLIDGEGFSLWVQREYWRATGAPPRKENLREALGVAKGRALFDGATHRTWIRVARDGDRLYLDLTNEDWQVIEIDADGWRLCADPPVRFRRVGGEAPLPFPEDDSLSTGAEHAVRELGELVRPQRPEHLKLIIGYMVASLCPDFPVPMLCFVCEYGSAKTSSLVAVRSHVDPRTLMTSGLPKSEDDALVAGKGQWTMSFDNLSRISPEMSDVLCRIVTGGGSYKRKLYTDADLHAIDLRRPMILTATQMPTNRPDFIDRAIILDLQVIERENRLTEREVRAKLEVLRPELLGRLLDGVSCALRRYDEARGALRGRLERMADFCIWVEAAAPAFGWANGEFLTVYSDMLEERKLATAEDDQLCGVIAGWLLKRDAAPFEGSAGLLLESLKRFADDPMRIGRRASEASWFPQTPRGLAGMLSERRKILAAMGIEYETEQHPHSRTRGRIHLLRMVDRSLAEEMYAGSAMAAREEWEAAALAEVVAASPTEDA